MCGVSKTFVVNARPEQLATVVSCPERRLGQDGKWRPATRPAPEHADAGALGKLGAGVDGRFVQLDRPFCGPSW